MSTIAATEKVRTGGMTKNERFVILASSLGTVFEWYDFYLFGSLASVIGAQFFGVIDPATKLPMFNQATRDIFALLAFAAGFIVRPFGAIVFGRVGDIVGRKYTFLVTILIMGLSTFIVGLLPNAATIGIAAPIILIGLRLLQGLALGGEYGGAATYVAEHAPMGKRGYYTSFIQTTATLGLFLSLLVILFVTAYVNNNFPGTACAGTVCTAIAAPYPALSDPALAGKTFTTAFQNWGWRIPFLVSVVLLGISVWIRLRLNELPVFQKMKDEGKSSKAPLTEAFADWSNAKIVILALVGGVMGQGVVWYTGQFYALFFMQSILKVDRLHGEPADRMVAAARHRLLHRVRRIVRQDRPQADHPGGLPDRGADLLPDLQVDHHQRQPGAGKGDRNREGGSRLRQGAVRRPVQPGRHPRLHRTLRHRSCLPGPAVGQVHHRLRCRRLRREGRRQRQGRALHGSRRRTRRCWRRCRPRAIRRPATPRS